MSLTPSHVRHTEVIEPLNADALFMQPTTSIIPKKITVEDFANFLEIGASVLYGGVNNIDEDVPTLIGGINGVSIHSKTINNV
jgi:hypothetical protein